ncbi:MULTISPECIES: hypothetical protein [Idiomarina]|nr:MULTISPECIES: hypothetical protein [Idiomarina]NCU58718.1 hypothetical protein [Idiomarina sp. FenA--70]NCU61414.1 hypothetical protein [Idiomarina sp. FenBw--71]UUN13094.1 hypothetical protein KGF88_10690 [Idiomarina loihiensis]
MANLDGGWPGIGGDQDYQLGGGGGGSGGGAGDTPSSENQDERDEYHTQL